MSSTATMCEPLSASSSTVAIAASPEKINGDPYGEGWMVKVRLSDVSEKDTLMDAAAYQETLS